MMKRPFAILVSILLVLCLDSCNLQNAATSGPVNSGEVATQVVLTLAAYTQFAQTASLSSPTLNQFSSPTLGQPTSTPTVAPSSTFTPTFGPSATMTLTLPPSATPIPKPGSIEGAISGYPYGSQPSLAIVAFGQAPPNYYSYMITNPGVSSFSMSSNYLIPGQFQVVAYDASGHSGGCPALVTVISEQTVTCDISNWGGGYPPKPSGVPNP
jgi:hypothetical protein